MLAGDIEIAAIVGLQPIAPFLRGQHHKRCEVWQRQSVKKDEGCLHAAIGHEEAALELR